MVLVAGTYWRNYQTALRKRDKKAAAHWKAKYDDHMKAWGGGGKPYVDSEDQILQMSERVERLEKRLEELEAGPKG